MLFSPYALAVRYLSQYRIRNSRPSSIGVRRDRILGNGRPTDLTEGGKFPLLPVSKLRFLSCELIGLPIHRGGLGDLLPDNLRVEQCKAF
jgi:hypothetical protein